MRHAFWVIVLLSLTVLPVTAQDTSGGWQLDTVQHLGELIEGDYTFANAVLSPDGSKIFWQEREGQRSCIYAFADESSTCFALPEDADLMTERFNMPVWSPDGTQIALHEDFILNARDSDIWLMNAATGTLTNRTDDNFSGAFFSAEGDAPLDYLPTWNPTSGELYFFRSARRDVPDDEVGWTLELYRLPAEGEPELVSDLTERVPGPLAVYRPVAFSVDGSRLAMIVLPQDWPENSGAGVWVLDLETDTVEQVATVEDFRQGLPAWYEEPLLPDTIQASQNGFVVFATAPQTRSMIPFSNVFLLDNETGTLSPLLDFSVVESEADMFRAESTVVFDIPRTGVVSLNGSAYWYLNFSPEARAAGISQIELSPGSEPVLLSEVDLVPGPGQQAPPTVSDDGRLLIYDILATFQPE